MKRFRNLRVGVRLGVASGVLGVLLLVLMAMAYRGETQLNQATHEVHVRARWRRAHGTGREHCVHAFATTKTSTGSHIATITRRRRRRATTCTRRGSRE